MKKPLIIAALIMCAVGAAYAETEVTERLPAKASPITATQVKIDLATIMKASVYMLFSPNDVVKAWPNYAYSVANAQNKDFCLKQSIIRKGNFQLGSLAMVRMEREQATYTGFLVTDEELVDSNMYTSGVDLQTLCRWLETGLLTSLTDTVSSSEWHLVTDRVIPSKEWTYDARLAIADSGAN